MNLSVPHASSFPMFDGFYFQVRTNKPLAGKSLRLKTRNSIQFRINLQIVSMQWFWMQHWNAVSIFIYIFVKIKLISAHQIDKWMNDEFQALIWSLMSNKNTINCIKTLSFHFI